MTRGNELIQVYVGKGKVNNQTQYIFTVHPRIKKSFTPIHIGTITIDSPSFTLSTVTEWKGEKQNANINIVYSFVTDINKYLTELLTYDIPDLSFLAGKLQYQKIEDVAVDWKTAKSPDRLAAIVLGRDEQMGIPDFSQAKYVLQIKNDPMYVTKDIYLKSIMPVNANYEFTMPKDFESLRKHLWWEICFPKPITEEAWEDRFEEVKGFTFRDGSRLIYTLPINSL